MKNIYTRHIYIFWLYKYRTSDWLLVTKELVVLAAMARCHKTFNSDKITNSKVGCLQKGSVGVQLLTAYIYIILYIYILYIYYILYIIYIYYIYNIYIYNIYNIYISMIHTKNKHMKKTNTLLDQQARVLLHQLSLLPWRQPWTSNKVPDLPSCVLQLVVSIVAFEEFLEEDLVATAVAKVWQELWPEALQALVVLVLVGLVLVALWRHQGGLVLAKREVLQ